MFKILHNTMRTTSTICPTVRLQASGSLFLATNKSRWFKKHVSTETDSTESILFHLENHRVNETITVDYKKAFNMIDHLIPLS